MHSCICAARPCAPPCRDTPGATQVDTEGADVELCGHFPTVATDTEFAPCHTPSIQRFRSHLQNGTLLRPADVQTRTPVAGCTSVSVTATRRVCVHGQAWVARNLQA